jgi:hypothetical protein
MPFAGNEHPAGSLKRRGELPGHVPDQEPEVRSPVTQIHQQIADLPHGPRTARVRGDPGNARRLLIVSTIAQSGHAAASPADLNGSARLGLTSPYPTPHAFSTSASIICCSNVRNISRTTSGSNSGDPVLYR